MGRVSYITNIQATRQPASLPSAEEAVQQGFREEHEGSGSMDLAEQAERTEATEKTGGQPLARERGQEGP